MLEKFHYPTPSGEIVLPRIGDLPGGVIRRNRNKESIDFVFSLVEETCDAATLALLDELPMSKVNDLFEKWQATSDVGESSGSST